jgi:hypothetical protein
VTAHTGQRCPWALKVGVLIHTRCHLGSGHERFRLHEGRGLESNPDQVIHWVPGSKREYQTLRTDTYAWEDPCPACGSVGTITNGVGLRARPIGTYSLAGGQMKVAAIEVLTLDCSNCGKKIFPTVDEETGEVTFTYQ